jgi:hypothetical protein
VFSPVQPFRSSNPQPNQKLEVGQGLEREEKRTEETLILI